YTPKNPGRSVTRHKTASGNNTTGTTNPDTSSVTNNTGDITGYGSACADALHHARIRDSITAADVTFPIGVDGFTLTTLVILAVARFKLLGPFASSYTRCPGAPSTRPTPRRSLGRSASEESGR